LSDELSIGEPQDSTSTSYLACKAVMEDALASIGRSPLRDSWRSHCKDAGRLPAASGGTIPFPLRLSLPPDPICLLGFGAGLQMARGRWRNLRGMRKYL